MTEMRKIGKKIDHTGKQFGLLKAVRLTENAKNQGARWICICECGNEKVITANNLVKGKAKSCGCATDRWRSEKNRTHGHTRWRGAVSGTYRSWHAARQRCENSSHIAYTDYGARGIAFCERWHDFTLFLADMGERPTGKTLDRKNVNKGYEPGNCRWATRSEQARNQRIKIRHSDVKALIAAAEAVVTLRDGDIQPAISDLQTALSEFLARRSTP